MRTLSGIYSYPIKGTRAIAHQDAVVEARGLAYDRRWMLVDGGDTFMTQRTHPSLALIYVRLEPQTLHVEAPGMPPLSVPKTTTRKQRRSVTVWDDVVDAVDLGDQIHAWFSRYLGTTCRLVFMDTTAERRVDPRFAVRGEEPVSFADGYPLLMTTEASLAALNERLEVPVPMDRFRPNLVVRGGQAYEEDRWRQVRIGDRRFHVVKPCARCVVTTIDQHTGKQGKEPLRTLSTFRRENGKVYFGQNLIPDAPGLIRVGDPVETIA